MMEIHPTENMVLDVSVIVPVFNEAGTLRELHKRITARMKLLGLSYEIIFVDDGSTDGTDKILDELCGADPAVGCIRHFRNHGKSLALMQGFDAARGDIAVTLDGDLQDEPENIGLLIKEMREGNYDLVNGRRVNRRDTASKRFVSWAFNRLVNAIFKPGVEDINSGMKAYSRKLYKRLNLRGDLHRLTPVIAANDGFRISEVPVSHAARRAGKSKYALLRYRGLLDIVSLMAIQSTQLRPFHVFGGLGLALFLAGGAAAAVLLVIHFSAGHQHVNVLFALLIQAAMLIGIFLIFVGLLAEMVVTSFQDGGWRRGWVKERREPGRSGNSGDSEP